MKVSLVSCLIAGFVSFSTAVFADEAVSSDDQEVMEGDVESDVDFDHRPGHPPRPRPNPGPGPQPGPVWEYTCKYEGTREFEAAGFTIADAQFKAMERCEDKAADEDSCQLGNCFEQADASFVCTATGMDTFKATAGSKSRAKKKAKKECMKKSLGDCELVRCKKQLDD